MSVRMFQKIIKNNNELTVYLNKLIEKNIENVSEDNKTKILKYILSENTNQPNIEITENELIDFIKQKYAEINRSDSNSPTTVAHNLIFSAATPSVPKPIGFNPKNKFVVNPGGKRTRRNKKQKTKKRRARSHKRR